MERETLERLLIDRALGALSPDADALLSAYLRTDATAADHARQWQDTADLARAALRDGPVGALPPFPAERLRLAGRLGAVRRAGWIAGAMAACVMLGLWVGAATFGGPRTSNNSSIIVNHAAPVDAPSDDAGFWSARRLLAHAGGGHARSEMRPIWESPIATPRMGELR